MSNDLAIATVTSTLRYVVQAALAADDTTGAQVTSVRPERAGDALGTPRVNIFLYMVSPSPAWRGADLPTRSPAGDLTQRPQVGLDLHYLISCYGDETQLVPQRSLGRVVSALHATPVLTPPLITAALADPDNAFLQRSDLAQQVERVKLAPYALSLEELSKLWSVFFQTPYVLTVAYQASVALIEAAVDARPARPVERTSVSVGIRGVGGAP